jgi:hypothetical protein
MNNRFSTRRIDAYQGLLYRAPGTYIDCALVYQTPWRICATASRLSHESHARASEETDRKLLSRLELMGNEHAKSLRGLQFYLLIEAPRYWWAEMDTYTIGVCSLGSTSTMHKEAKGAKGDELVALKSNLSEGTLQLRMKCISYPSLKRMIEQRHDHRLPEWQEFCEFAGIILNNSLT